MVFPVVLFISIEKVSLIFDSEDEYLPLVLFIFLKKMTLTFDSAEVLWDDYLMKATEKYYCSPW